MTSRCQVFEELLSAHLDGELAPEETVAAGGANGTTTPEAACSVVIGSRSVLACKPGWALDGAALMPAPPGALMSSSAGASAALATAALPTGALAQPVNQSTAPRPRIASNFIETGSSTRAVRQRG